MAHGVKNALGTNTIIAKGTVTWRMQSEGIESYALKPLSIMVEDANAAEKIPWSFWQLTILEAEEMFIENQSEEALVIFTNG